MSAECSSIAFDITMQHRQNGIPLFPMVQSQHDQLFSICKGVKATGERSYNRFDILIAAGWIKLQVNWNQPTRVDHPAAAQQQLKSDPTMLVIQKAKQYKLPSAPAIQMTGPFLAEQMTAPLIGWSASGINPQTADIPFDVEQQTPAFGWTLNAYLQNSLFT